MIDYNINIRLIEPAADFKVTGTHTGGQYKLEVNCILNEAIRNLMKNNQMIVVVVAKSNDIRISSSTHEGYVVDDKKVTLTLNGFNSLQAFLVGMIFETPEVEFVEVVKVSYRYMVSDK
jgi:hypothetical protein